MTERNMIVNLHRSLTRKYGQRVRFCVITFDDSKAQYLYSDKTDYWFTDAETLKKKLDEITYVYTQADVDRERAFNSLRKVYFDKDAAKYVFQILNGNSRSSNYFDLLKSYAGNNVNYSEILPYGASYLSSSFYDELKRLIKDTNGICISYDQNLEDTLYQHICQYAVSQKDLFHVIVPTGWKTITLVDELNARNGANSDTDGLTDWEEVCTEKLKWDKDGGLVLPTIAESMGAYSEEGLERFRSGKRDSGMPPTEFEKYFDYVMNSTYILPILSDPTDPDSDGDGLYDDEESALGTKAFCIDSDNDLVDDEEEYFLGLNPLSKDTDQDKMTDGLELSLGYDPFDPNPDKDDYLDYEEFIHGTDPYVYEHVKDFWEHAGDITKGVIFGDFIDDDEVDADILVGQIAGGFIPIAADARDVVANISKGDWGMAVLSGIGFIPTGGDAAKIIGDLGQFVTKMGDDIPSIIKLIIGVAEAHPEVVKYIGKSDEVADAIKKSSVSEEITKESLEKVLKYSDEAGLALSKASDVLKHSGEVIDSGQDVWKKGACLRGQLIDELLNKHSIKDGLGVNFPVFDRLEGDVLISTKSIDLGAKSYRDPKKLERRIQSYINKMNDFEKKYPEVLSDTGMTWGRQPLHKSQYNSKKLELVIPDIPLSEGQKEVLEKFNNISIVIMKG